MSANQGKKKDEAGNGALGPERTELQHDWVSTWARSGRRWAEPEFATRLTSSRRVARCPRSRREQHAAIALEEQERLVSHRREVPHHVVAVVRRHVGRWQVLRRVGSNEGTQRGRSP